MSQPPETADPVGVESRDCRRDRPADRTGAVEADRMSSIKLDDTSRLPARCPSRDYRIRGLTSLTWWATPLSLARYMAPASRVGQCPSPGGDEAVASGDSRRPHTAAECSRWQIPPRSARRLGAIVFREHRPVGLNTSNGRDAHLPDHVRSCSAAAYTGDVRIDVSGEHADAVDRMRK